MVRRVFGPIALLTVIGALAIAAVGFAANAATSKPSAPSTSAPAYMPAAAHTHGKGNCPNMGGDSQAPSSSSSSSQSEL